MAKTNFTKAENLLKENLTKIEVTRLGKIADIAQKVKPEMRKLIEQAATVGAKAELDRKLLLRRILRAMKEFNSPEFYQAIGMSSDELETLLKDPSEISPDDWNRLYIIREKIMSFRKSYQETHPEVSESTLIEKERHRHINKRFNVNEKWLPLK